jgi:molybdate transport system substrate-binding protein
MRRAVATAAAALVLVVAACGEKAEPTDGAGASSGTRLTVSAASSLKGALDAYAKRFSGADVKAQFAGSDELAAQIEQGVTPDVFAAANTRLPEQLFDDGLVEEPRVFAGNELVLAVPAEGAKVRSLDDLAGKGVKLAIGSKDVPVGSYTRDVLARLGGAQEKGILANVRSEEPDVKGVVGKLTQGAVDAGFVYRTDVKAAGSELRAIALPSRLQPKVAYGAAVVKGSEHAALARRYIEGLVSGQGQEALRAAGFLPPP